MNDSGTKQRSRAWVKRIAWGVATFVVVGGAAYKFNRPLPVPAVKIDKTTVVQTVVATGRIAPPATVEMGPSQPGNVTIVSVKEGDAVKAGTLLVHLDDRELLARRAALAESVAQSRLKLDSLRRVLSPKAIEDLKQADIAVRQAEDDANRSVLLRNVGAANDADLERAKLTLDQARSRRESLAVQAGSVSAGGVEFRMALSSLSQAEASLLEIDARIVDTHLTARVDGTVMALRVDVGDTVQPGQVLVVLAASGSLEVRVPIDEKNIAGVEPGKPAFVSAEAYPDRHFPGVVTRLSPAVDATRGTVEVTLTLPSPPAYLRPDMTVSVEIEIARRASALAVPREAVDEGRDGQSLLVLTGGRAERRAVALGIRGIDAVEIVKGLAQGDVVLLPGAVSIEPGSKVSANFEAAPKTGAEP